MWQGKGGLIHSRLYRHQSGKLAAPMTRSPVYIRCCPNIRELISKSLECVGSPSLSNESTYIAGQLSSHCVYDAAALVACNAHHFKSWS